jgi:hypothetical protein
MSIPWPLAFWMVIMLLYLPVFNRYSRASFSPRFPTLRQVLLLAL